MLPAVRQAERPVLQKVKTLAHLGMDVSLAETLRVYSEALRADKPLPPGGYRDLFSPFELTSPSNGAPETSPAAPAAREPTPAPVDAGGADSFPSISASATSVNGSPGAPEGGVLADVPLSELRGSAPDHPRNDENACPLSIQQELQDLASCTGGVDVTGNDPHSRSPKVPRLSLGSSALFNLD